MACAELVAGGEEDEDASKRPTTLIEEARRLVKAAGTLMELTAALPNINHAEGGSGSGATALSTLPSGTNYGGAVTAVATVPMSVRSPRQGLVQAW